MSNDWTGIDGGTLAVMYHSIEPSDFNEPTAAQWDRILDEIGQELDRRRLGFEAETGTLTASAHETFRP